jgi:hypothetical protein
MAMSFLRHAPRALSAVAAAACAFAAPAAASAQTPPPASSAGGASASPAAGTAAPPAAGAPASATGAAASPEAGTLQAPFVYVNGPQGVLEGRSKARGKRAGDDDDDDDDDDAWQAICPLPCRRTLDPSIAYRISGPGVTDTDAFRLPAGRANLRLDVDPGSRSSRVTGIVFIPVGATALGTGLLVAAVGGLAEEDDVTRGGLIAAAAGAFLMTGGIVLARSNRTTVTTSEPSIQLASGVALTPRGVVF